MLSLTIGPKWNTNTMNKKSYCSAIGWRIGQTQRGLGPIQSLFTSDVREMAAGEMELDDQQNGQRARLPPANGGAGCGEPANGGEGRGESANGAANQIYGGEWAKRQGNGESASIPLVGFG